MFSEYLPLDLVPFAGLSWWLIAGIGAVHFFGFFIRGAFGFGSNMPIVLLTAWLLAPHHAIVLAMLTAAVAQLHLLPQAGRAADWRVTGRVMPGLMAGIALGTWVFAELAAQSLTVVMGGLIVTIVALDRLRLIERAARRLPLRAPLVVTSLAAIGATAGTISGGGTIYFLVSYLKLVCATPASLRGTNIAVSGLFMIVRISAIGVTGFILPSLIVEAAILVPAVFLGTWCGTRAFERAAPDRFYKALQLLLLAAALALVAKGVYSLF